jgi:N-acetylneuraminate synthase
MNEVYVIAEAGINHNGDLSIAKKLMDLAAETNCDAIKFQKRTPDICVPESMKNVSRETPWGQMTYLEYKKRIEFGRDEYDEIDRYSKEIGLTWSASAWDIDSLTFLDRYPLDFHKVASAMTTNVDFVTEVARRGKPTYVSTGMCTWPEIDQVVDIFDRLGCPLTLMHTVSTYPADPSHLNLKMIHTLRDRYPGIPVGYSGHESSVSPTIVAVALGAVAVERHITLNRSMWGTDHSASLEPAGLRQLMGSLRKIPTIMGDGVRKSVPGEEEVAGKLRYWL